MVRANVYTKTVKEQILYKIELIATVKGNEHKKEFKGIIKSKNELSEPIDIIIGSLKKKNIEINLVSNAKFVVKIANAYKGETKFHAEQKDISISFEDMESYLQENDPLIPSLLRTRYNDLKSEGFLKDLEASMIFLKAYLYFQENQQDTKDIPLLEDLISQGKLDKESMIEDIFAIIEDYLTK